jgi:DNA-binding NarL/FixJ family response regulator
MAERRLSILLALADRERAEDLAVHLAEEHGMLVALAGELDPEDHGVEHYDAVLAAEPVDDETPHVILGERPVGEEAAGNIFAVLPSSTGDGLVGAALRLAAAGYRISKTASGRTTTHTDDLQPINGNAGPAPATVRAAIVLTQREKQVVALLAEGASNKLIARRLGISVHTAKFHVAAILQKLGAVNRTDAIAIAMREGLILV